MINRIKKVACLLLLVTSFITVATQSSHQIAVTQLSKNVYALNGQGFGSNVGVVVDDDGLLLIDAMSPGEKNHKALMAALRTISDKPVKFVINTHAHRDHAGGNQFFADLGATIIAQSHVRYIPKTSNRYKATYNQILAADHMTITFAGLTIDLYPKMSHTHHDLIVHIPAADVVFTGDNHATDWGPNIGATGLKGQLALLDFVMSLTTNASHVVPGHGEVTNKAHVLAYKQHTKKWYQTIANLYKQGKTPAQMLDNADLQQSIAFFAGEGDNEGYLKPENIQRRIQRTLSGFLPNAIVIDDLAHYQGLYIQQDGTNLIVKLINNKLFAKVDGGFMAQLIPTNERTFRLRGWGENEVVEFTLSPTKQVTNATLHIEAI